MGEGETQERGGRAELVQKERKTDRQTDRQTDREREREREREHSEFAVDLGPDPSMASRLTAISTKQAVGPRSVEQ